MAQQLGSMAVGSIVQIKENGVLSEYIIAHQGIPHPALKYEDGSWTDVEYDDSCDGTWLVRKNAFDETRAWDDGNDSKYETSSIDSWLNGDFINMLEPAIRSRIKRVKIPYIKGGASGSYTSGASGLLRRVFLLEENETGLLGVGWGIGGAEPTLDMFRPMTSTSVACLTDSGNNASWATRTPSRVTSQNRTYDSLWYHHFLRASEWYSEIPVTTAAYTRKYHIRPTMVMDSTLVVADDGRLIAYSVSTLTTPDTAMTGQAIPISWSAAEEATTYVLERKADTDADWVQLYSGANLSYTDTAGSWTSVQYRVKAGAGSDFGDYTTSKSIPVVSASALVISGEDEDLGTITGDLTYTVISDTGNPITLERRVNGRLVAKGTVNSGFSYPISVFDLPTGAGTIELSASVTSGSATVTATRTWTYTKTPVTFPEEGGPAQLTQGGQNVFPATIAEAVRTTTALGGTLDKTLELLAPLLNSAVISVGTYTGTGTFGADNPNTLTFDSAPSIVTIYGGGKAIAISSTDTEGTAYIDGTSAKWYADTAENQLNVSGTTYSYIAIGEVTES